METVIKVTPIPFNEMDEGAKKETLRDFIGMVTGNRNNLIGDFMHALTYSILDEQYALIADDLYKRNERFKHFADTGFDSPIYRQKKMVKNHDFDVVMEKSFDGSADWNPMGTGVIYKAQAYKQAKKLWPDGIIDSIPVVSIDNGTLIGRVPEKVEEE